MVKKDIWHYPRIDLAKQVLGMFASGLSSALVFFAPRRMGKTEFLLKDVKPLAEKQHWHVLYFSFLDAGSNAIASFTLALVNFAIDTGVVKKNMFQEHIKKISAGVAGINAGIEFHNIKQSEMTLKEVMTKLGQHNHKILLLLDEVQSLATEEKNKDFIAALRTALDINKDSIKVIFTGSSREGLRRMFSKSDAPFFHFGQNLPFPEFNQDFIDHLTHVFNKATQRDINASNLWDIFVELGKVPQLIRSLVERLVLHPDLTLEQVKQNLLQDITEDREYALTWDNASALEQLILKAIVKHESELFSENKRVEFAKRMGVETLSVSTVQSAIRTLQRKQVIGNSAERGIYYIDDPNFKDWIQYIILEASEK